MDRANDKDVSISKCEGELSGSQAVSQQPCGADNTIVPALLSPLCYEKTVTL